MEHGKYFFKPMFDKTHIDTEQDASAVAHALSIPAWHVYSNGKKVFTMAYRKKKPGSRKIAWSREKPGVGNSLQLNKNKIVWSREKPWGRKKKKPGSSEKPWLAFALKDLPDVKTHPEIAAAIREVQDDDSTAENVLNVTGAEAVRKKKKPGSRKKKKDWSRKTPGKKTGSCKKKKARKKPESPEKPYLPFAPKDLPDKEIHREIAAAIREAQDDDSTAENVLDITGADAVRKSIKRMKNTPWDKMLRPWNEKMKEFLPPPHDDPARQRKQHKRAQSRQQRDRHLRVSRKSTPILKRSRQRLPSGQRHILVRLFPAYLMLYSPQSWLMYLCFPIQHSTNAPPQQSKPRGSWTKSNSIVS